MRPGKDISSDTTNVFNREEQQVVVEIVEEFSRCWHYELVFPRSATVESYRKFFKVQRSANLIVWKWLKMKK